MISYVIRHGRTSLSERHLVNGDPRVPVALDEVGELQCRRLSTAAWVPGVVTSIVSGFGRCHQTADLILADPDRESVSEPSLNEIRYGIFEGGPWMAYGAWLGAAGPDQAPPGGGEARRSAVERMLIGLRRCLRLPGPRLIVTHGLLWSVLLRLRDGGTADEWELPEAPYAEPLALDDRTLHQLIDAGLGSAS
jgi:2,3-bisphosphoglycerate-dependent phosphoglycerate mutase